MHRVPLNDFTDWNEIIEYDFCPHRDYQIAVSHKVKSFQQTGSFATGVSENKDKTPKHENQCFGPLVMVSTNT